MPGNKQEKAKAFLVEREQYCVAASARFLNIRKSRGHVWHLENDDADLFGLLIHSRRTLFPVFNKDLYNGNPQFINRIPGIMPIHAVQGLRDDTDILLSIMKDKGYFAAEYVDYDLMNIEKGTVPIKAGIPGLVLRGNVPGDEEEIFVLQSEYEKEEVLPKNAVFDPAVCRLNLKHILSSEKMLLAELNGEIIGKINTSAKSFSMYQIGGVYVRPDCRGRGIGLAMTAAFTEKLLAEGKGISLFVKKSNAAAKAIYRKAGYEVISDYRISYF